MNLSEAIQLTYTLHWAGTKNEDHALANAQSMAFILGPTTPVDKVDRKMLSAAVVVMKRRGLSGSTVNRKLAAIGKVLNTAHWSGHRAEEFPSGFRQKEGRPRERLIDDRELELMLVQLSPAMGRLVLFLRDTGCRVSEALDLRARDVRRSSPPGEQQPGGYAAWATFADTKNGRTRTVPVSHRAYTNLMLDLFCDDERVFGQITQDAFNTAWSRARASIGLAYDTEFVPHALRHTCATDMIRKGMPLSAVQRWLGHMSVTVTQRYTHLCDQDLLDAANKTL